MATLGAETGRVLLDGRELRVRSARPRDAGALFQLLESVAGETEPTLLIRPGESTAKLWRRRISAAGLDYRSLFLLGVLDGEVVGNLGLERDPHPNSSHVAWVGMSVGREWRGLGVGSTLLGIAIDWAAGNGAEKLALSVFPENARALAFYERHGFAREGLREAQYQRNGRYHDEVLMARFLTPLAEGAEHAS